MSEEGPEKCHCPFCGETESLSQCTKCKWLTCEYHIKIRDGDKRLCELCSPDCEKCWDIANTQECHKCRKRFCNHCYGKGACKRCCLMQLVEEADDEEIDQIYDELGIN